MDKKLLEILVCPVTKGALIYDKDKQELISKAARLAYPIRDNVPDVGGRSASVNPREVEQLAG